jgi:hypothetical protein
MIEAIKTLDSIENRDCGFLDPATAVSLTPTGLGLGGQKDSAANGYH